MEGTPVEVEARAQHARLAPVRVLAGLFVPAALAVASAVLVWAASAPIDDVRAPGPAPVDALLALGAVLVCAGLLAVATVGATLSLAAALTGQVAGRLGRLAQLLTPRAVQAAVGLAVGVTVMTGPVAGASTASVATRVTATAAATQESPEWPSQAPPLPSGWSPDRPAALDPEHQAPAGQLVAIPRHARVSTRPAGTDRSGTVDHPAPVVVQRGDTLWGIAARHLGPGATDAQVAAAWPRWYVANRFTIGPHPELILPGQRLQAPESRASTHGEESP